MMFRSCISILLSCVVFTACGLMKQSSGKPLGPQDYLKWYTSADYPYRDTVVENGITYILERLPAEVEIARNLQSGRITAEEAKESYASQRDEKNLTYQLIVQLPGVGKDIYNYNVKEGESSSDRASYFAFGMKKDLLLLTGPVDTIDCSGLITERGLSNFPRSKFSMDFGGADFEQATQLLFKDRYLSEKLISFDLKPFQKKVPKLTIK